MSVLWGSGEDEDDDDEDDDKDEDSEGLLPFFSVENCSKLHNSITMWKHHWTKTWQHFVGKIDDSLYFYFNIIQPTVVNTLWI